MREFLSTGVSRCDPWKGWLPVYIEPYRTKRLGKPQMRYRIRSGDWAWHLTFTKPEVALRHAKAMAASRVDFRMEKTAASAT